MRPDEHKKKKNSQYKKKHGIQSNVPGSDNKKETKTHHGAKEDAEIANEKTQKKTGDDAVLNTKFSKRTLRNNWERYEPLESCDEDVGVDFNVLLSFAGSSSSHMQLELEKEWLDSGENDLTTITIDRKRLGEVVAKLSFEEKYRLNDLGLDPDILKCISNLSQSETDSNHAENCNLLAYATTGDMGFNFSNLQLNDGIGKKNTSQPLPSSSVMSGFLPTTLETNQKPKITQECVVGSAKITDNSKIFPQQGDGKKLSDLDSVVEELLSSKCSVVENDTTDGEQENTKRIITTKVPNPIQITNPAVSGMGTCDGEKNEGSLKTDDLEEWLDSIL